MRRDRALPDDWTEPGVYAVGPGIHRIPLPLPNDGLRAVNVYAIEDAGGLTLIDSGWALALAQERLEEALHRIGHELGDVRRFLVTHVHRDHYTLGVVLRRLFGSRIAVGRGEEPNLSRILEAGRQPELPHITELRRDGADVVVERLLAAGTGERTNDWAPPDDWLDDGDEIALRDHTLRVVHTPGHTRGHVVFAELGKGLLFAGDHVLPHITPSIGFQAARAPLPLGDFLASLRTVRAMPDLRLLPAHGPTAESTHARVDELIAHHEQRLDESLKAVVDGASTAYEAARVLRWTRRLRRLDDLDPYNQMLAVMETAAHLDVLVRDGRLTASDEAGVTHYAA
ncbi:MAG TPA: MBL fold metallo-hydrolase [Streptosporangiales bacterium]